MPTHRKFPFGVLFVVVLSGCSRSESPAAPEGLTPVAAISGPGIAAANGTVTAKLTPTRAIFITVADPDGIRNVQVVGLLQAGAQLEQSRVMACQKTVSFTVGSLAVSHVPHAHRVTYTDCLAGTPDKANPGVSSETEVWEVPAGDKTNMTARLKHQVEDNPRIIDANPGNKRFYALLIGGQFIPNTDDRCKALLPKVEAALKAHPNWQAQPSRITTLLEGQATRLTVTAALTAAKAAARPGDEFLFYYCDHGKNNKPDDIPVDEVETGDGKLHLANPGQQPPYEQIKDDELTTMLSGFQPGVTMTVLIEACHSASFTDGSADLLNITDASVPTPARVDKDHLAVLTSALKCEIALGDFTLGLEFCLGKQGNNVRADVNTNGVTTSEEMFNCIIRFMRVSTPRFARGVGP
jgi:hypothetical protein